MAGTRADSGSPASSDDGSSEGGAPLYAWSPERRVLRAEEGAGSRTRNNSATSSETGDFGDCTGKYHGEKDARTPALFQPRRAFSKSTLQAAASAYLNQTSTSIGAVPPSLTLSAYPGPGAAAPRQPSLSLLAPVPPVVGSAVPVPAAIAASQAQGRAVIPGSTTHSFISAMQTMNLNAAEEDLHPAQKTHRDQTCKLQSRVWGLRQGMYRQPSIPQEFLTSFDYDVQELMNNTVKLNQAVDNLAAELKTAKGEQENIRGLEATVRGLKGDLKEYKERSQNAEKTLGSLAERSDEDMRTIQFLKEQLRQGEMSRTILHEQVNGKRNLWLNVHNDPQERAAVLGNLARSSTPLSGQTFANPMDQAYAQSVRGPGSRGPGSVFSGTSHTTSVKLGNERPRSVAPGNAYHGGAPYPGGHFAGGYPPFQSISHSHSGPAVYTGQPQHQHRPSTATGSSVNAPAYAGSRHSVGPVSRPSTGPRRNLRAPTSTETGSPKERKRNTPRTLVRADLEDADSLKWADEFQSLFALVYGFCASYFHELPQINTDWKGHIRTEANGELWEYICRICQTSQEQERGEHALRLLKDRDSRPYLLQRLILQHIIVFICSYEGWKDYSEDVDDEMEKLDGDLKKIDPSKTYERQVILDRRAQLVADMMQGANAAPFRNFKLTQHHQYLKTMVAPFLAKGKNSNVTNEAFYDLFTITTTAWDLSAKLFRSRLTFQYMWNDAGVRFSAETHEPYDCIVDRLTLQHEHCRVRLCATPAVTVRNDQGMTIDTKNILKSGVLVMRY
ncbi:hypothetical protein C8A00DRAFT_42288 [Chaetomidium leptoderma]|uniref:Uncharacterized protein n=1 Tax=Chaetomidium leptoderma TaxID=669021 RepID=A0AAN6VNV5_9PEZI|nr:hypothetical protein C8A00DRAFT_42288 [Chaetomidium leptoderma]